MKKVTVFLVLCALASFAQAAYVTESFVDTMDDASYQDGPGRIAYYNQSGTGWNDPWYGDGVLPEDTAEVINTTLNSGWFSYTIDPSVSDSYFGIVTVVRALDTTKTNYISVRENAGMTYINPVSTETVTLSGAWNWIKETYDFTSYATRGVTVIMYSGTDGAEWSSKISTVDATIIPEPATIALLSLGGMFCMRRRK